MDLVKYLIAGVVSLVIGIIAMFMGNFLSGILIFILLFGSYIMWNVLKNVKDVPPRDTSTPPKDN